MKRPILIVFFLIFFYHCSAQEITDTTQVFQLLKTAKNLEKADIDSAILLFQKAEIAAIKLGDKNTMMHCYYDFGLYLFNHKKIHESYPLLEKAHNLAKELQNKDYYYKSKIYIGTFYILTSNYNLATEYCLDALEYFEKEKNYFLISGTYLNLTFIQIEQKDYDIALEYAESSLKYSKLADNKVYESKSFLNMGEIYLLKNDYDKAIFYYKKSLKIIKENNIADFTSSNIYLNIGNVFLKSNQADSAEFYIKIIDTSKQSTHTKMLINIYYSKLSVLRNDYNKALEYAQKAVKIGNAENYEELRKKVFLLIAEIYTKKNDYKTAYKYRLQYEQIKDSIFSAEKYKIQNELEIIYEANKKQQTIDLLSSEKEISDLKNQQAIFILISLILIFISILILVTLFYRKNKLKAKHTAIELEQKLLRTQMNPHFIFNSISAIQNYIINSNPLDASSYLSDFAKLMRATLTNSSNDFISLQDEIETIENYLKLQHLRLSNKFDYKIIISEEIDTEDFSVPPMLLQPFIENSIIHAFTNELETKGLITTSYYLSNDKLVMETSDNGIGRKNSKKETNSKHVSKAIDITSQRIELLNKKHKKKISFEIIDLRNTNNLPTGTLVRFTLPIN